MKYFICAVVATNVIVALFFFQTLTYAILSYVFHWRKKRNTELSLGDLETASKANGRPLPKFTLVIAAKNESDIIAATINKMIDIDYPKDKVRILFALDGKELEENGPCETTHHFVEERKAFLNKLYNTALVDYVSVPPDFDGCYPGILTGRVVASTKPRALNWAMRFIEADTDVVGFFDADSHPEKGTLLYVAHKYITEPEKSILLQGSVIQVRNYFQISAINKIYAIFQGITHEWFLPILLKHLPFIGGTNFFVDKNLLYKLEGFNLKSLTEDLDFGIRAYMKEKQWPEFLPYVTTEQTPPNYKAYFFQRARWATGFLQITENLMKQKVSKAALYILSGLLFYGIIPLMLFQIISFVSISLLLPSLTGIIDTSHFFTFKLKAFFIAMNVLYFLFILYYYERSKSRGYIQMPAVKPRFGIAGEYLTFVGLLVAPFFGCLPFTYGFFNLLLNRSSLKWVKTPRTAESSI